MALHRDPLRAEALTAHCYPYEVSVPALLPEQKAVCPEAADLQAVSASPYSDPAAWVLRTVSASRYLSHWALALSSDT